GGGRGGVVGEGLKAGRGGGGGSWVFGLFFFFQAEDGIRDLTVTGVQTCALPICCLAGGRLHRQSRQPPDGQSDGRHRRNAAAGARSVGTSLLFELSKPPAGLHHGLLERRELERSGQAI